MVIVQKLSKIEIATLDRILSGYVSQEKYQVTWQESDETISFRLELISLETPYVKRFDLEDADYYESVFDPELSFAVYGEHEMLAFAICEGQAWNASFWIREFHVARAYHGKGIGRLLMNALTEKASAAAFRVMVLECQNSNVPAIRFYRRMGFRIEALDMSLYSNQDYPDGEIALFMKRRLK